MHVVRSVNKLDLTSLVQSWHPIFIQFSDLQSDHTSGSSRLNAELIDNSSHLHKKTQFKVLLFAGRGFKL
jgi:hypothetical protein